MDMRDRNDRWINKFIPDDPATARLSSNMKQAHPGPLNKIQLVQSTLEILGYKSLFLQCTS